MGVCMSSYDKDIMNSKHMSPGEKIESMLAATIGPSEYQNQVYDNRLKLKRIEIMDDGRFRTKRIISELYMKY